MVFEAATKGCVSSLQQLLIKDPLILDSVSTSETPLHVAAKLGHVDFVKKIIEIKPELTKELNAQGSSPLHLASAEGHVEVVRALLLVDDQMCLVRDTNEHTPLYLAVIEGRYDVIKLLLVAKPDAVRLASSGGDTILHYCVKNYRLETLKVIMLMCDPQFLSSKDDYGNTALHLAVAIKQVKTIEVLLSMAKPILEVNAQNVDGLTARDVLLLSKCNMRDSLITNALQRVGGREASFINETRKEVKEDASSLYPWEVVKLVLICFAMAYYIPLFMCGLISWTTVKRSVCVFVILFICFYVKIWYRCKLYRSGIGNLETQTQSQVLAVYKRGPNASRGAINSKKTAKIMVFEAATKGCVSSLQQLLIKDPLILDSVSTSETPLHVAAKLGHVDFVKKIIEIKPKLTKELNAQGSSPLHLASAEGHVEVVRTLLLVDDQMCLVRDRNEHTPLYLAVIEGRYDVIKLLLVAKPDAVRLALSGGDTILHYCVKNYRLETLKVIMLMCDPQFFNSKDDCGNTALHLAVAIMQVKSIEVLFSMAKPILKVNEQNVDGFTAMDVLLLSKCNMRDSLIKKALRRVGGREGSFIKRTTRNEVEEEDGSSPWEFLVLVLGIMAISIYTPLYMNGEISWTTVKRGVCAYLFIFIRFYIKVWYRCKLYRYGIGNLETQAQSQLLTVYKRGPNASRGR